MIVCARSERDRGSEKRGNEREKSFEKNFGFDWNRRRKEKLRKEREKKEKKWEME
jgi:hypothetical protein